MQSKSTIKNTDPTTQPDTLFKGEAVNHAIRIFQAISLEEMDSVKLMNRFDKKFVFSSDKLPALLKSAEKHYKILQINSDRMFRYSSVYFDTVGHGMYHDHHNQKLNRFKVRRRKYVNSGHIFLEIKFKTNKGQTRKKRMLTANENKCFVKDEKKFLKKLTPYRAKVLYPALYNTFDRITLVHKQKAERITIDMNLSFENTSGSKELPLLTIVEIKLDRSSGFSDIEKIFRQHHILPLKFSKYCMGMVLLNPEIKYNRFKQKYLKLKKISNDSGHASSNN